jgi:transcriptional regulator with XRE-family HTH domain
MGKRRRATARSADQARKVGESVQLRRAAAGLTRTQAAARAGIARSTFERIEAGEPGVALDTLVAACDPVGLDLVCQTYPGRSLSLRDKGQMGVAQLLADMASSRWRVTLEEPSGDHGEATDMVFWGPDEIVAVEIERLVVSYESQRRRASVKRDWLAARHHRPVRLVMVIEDTARNRAAMSPWERVLTSTMPLGSRAVFSSIRTGAPLGNDGLCWIRPPARHARLPTNRAQINVDPATRARTPDSPGIDTRESGSG